MAGQPWKLSHTGHVLTFVSLKIRLSMHEVSNTALRLASMNWFKFAKLKFAPELDWYPDGNIRIRVWRRVRNRILNKASYVLLFCCVEGVLIATSYYLPTILGVPLELRSTWRLCSFIVEFVTPVLLFLCYRQLIRSELRTEASISSMLYCANCGYDLRGTQSGICSECGTPVSARQVQSIHDQLSK